MSYNYETMKPEIFTESGQRILDEIKSNIKGYKSVGLRSVTVSNLIKGVCGDSWVMLACVDYLEELNRIQLIEEGSMIQFNLYSI